METVFKKVTDGEGMKWKHYGNSVQGAHADQLRLLLQVRGGRDVKNRTEIHRKPGFISFVSNGVTSLLSEYTFLTRNEIFTNYKKKFTKVIQQVFYRKVITSHSIY